MASPIQDNKELSEAINFFVNLANEIPAYRDHVLSPTGLTLLINNLKKMVHLVDEDGDEERNRMCYTMRIVSTFQWCHFLIIQLDVYHSLVKLLVYVILLCFPSLYSLTTGTCNKSSVLNSQNLTLLNTWTASHIITTIHNLTPLGGDNGRQAIQGTSTVELQQICSNIEKRVRTIVGSTEADGVQSCILHIWPQD